MPESETPNRKCAGCESPLKRGPRERNPRRWWWKPVESAPTGPRRHRDGHEWAAAGCDGALRS